MRAMMVDTCSGPDTQQKSPNSSTQTTRTSPPSLSLRDATCRMWSRLSGGIPQDIQNIVFGFTRSEPRIKKGHLLGSWPRVSESLARAGVPLVDLMAPVNEHAAHLKREFYHASLPTLAAAEQIEADAECRLRKAELEAARVVTGRTLSDVRRAAEEEVEAAEIILEIVDRKPCGQAC